MRIPVKAKDSCSPLWFKNDIRCLVRVTNRLFQKSVLIGMDNALEDLSQLYKLDDESDQESQINFPPQSSSDHGRPMLPTFKIVASG